MRRATALAAVGSMIPSAASACTWCVSSAFGDRTFSWPYLILIAVPFVVGSAIVGILAFHHGKLRPFKPALPLDKEMT